MKRWTLAVALAACAPAFGASFDCAKARGTVERTVCANAELSDLDEVLARYYHGAAGTLKENAACLREDQQQWLRGKRERCGNAACLRAAYLERLGELSALQPGINTKRQLALPPVPALVWIMAPKPGEAPVVPSRPAIVEGALRYDENAGAYVVRDAGGKLYALLLDIDRGGSNEVYLSSLAQTLSGGYKVAARGRLADGRPIPFFDHRHCTFIYRLPT